MDLFGLVQTVVDLAKAHEEFGEEVKQFQMRLSLLQDHLQKLESHNFQINAKLQDEINRELTESSHLLKKLPDRSSVINTLLAKLPFGSVYNDIKEKSQALDRLSQQLSTQLITSLAVGQNNRPQTNQHVEETQIDTDLAINDKLNCRVSLKLISDDHIKQQFRRNIINTTEVIELEFAKNNDEMEVFKFGREYYRKLQMEVQQVQTISREHAIITCTRKLKTKKEEEKFEVPSKKVKVDQQQQQQQQLPQSAEVFYTCYDMVQQDVVQPTDEQKYEYTFKLLNKSPNCVFIQRGEETKKNDDDIILGTWNRVTPNKIITLKERDKIAILMKKPDYKFPIIAYEFDVLL